MAKQKKPTDLERMEMRAMVAEDNIIFAGSQAWTNTTVLDDVLERLDSITSGNPAAQELYRIKATLKLVRASLCQIYLDSLNTGD